MIDLHLLALPDADLDAIAALHERCFDECWSASFLSSVLAAPGCFGVVAGPNSAPDAFIVGRVAADEVEVLTLAVQPESRRRGIGGALVDFAASHAARLGAKAMFLEVGRSNATARSIYATRGFLPVGERRGYYDSGSGPREDAIILRASLPLDPLGKGMDSDKLVRNEISRRRT
jgi:ribosomal-protein-alanine N-acetyltransferase